jgi:uncharacterized membrane protein
MLKTIPIIFLTLAMFVSPSAAQFAEQRVVTNICNSDGTATVKYAVRDNDGLGGVSEGWYRIDPNECVDVYRYSMDRTEHHFVFTSDGEQLPLFWEGQHAGGKFCTSSKAFEYLENFLNMNRSQKCRGDETLMKANYKVTFYDNVNDFLVIPPFSAKAAAADAPATSPKPSSNSNDGKICSAFGLCLKWPPS